ncbi:hypothetical protein [Legionella birminghamensis]|nr:hypothetical protein [Legionella birminghamensis]
MMRQLRQVVQLEPSITHEGKEVWQAANLLAEKPQAFFEPFVQDHLKWTLDYSILCTHLAREFVLRPDSPELTELLAVALLYAELLEYVYRYYINVPREVLRLRKEKTVYRHYLEKRGYLFEPEGELKLEADTITQKMRNDTAWINPYRLIFIRGKRLLNALVPLLNRVERYGQVIATADKILNPALAYLGWIFFGPRLFSNLFILIKHSVPGPWMTEQEKNLGFWFRFLAQLQRRYFEIGNDVVWFAAGILNCFVFVGPLAPIAVYFSLACFVYDIIWASVRAGIEIYRFNQLKAQYAEMAEDIKDDDSRRDEYEALLRHQKILDHRIRMETYRVLTTVATTTGVCLGFILMLPLFMANPLIPVIGAILFLSATVAGFLATRYFEEQRPRDQLQLPQSPKAEKPGIASSPYLFFSSNDRKEDKEIDFEFDETLLPQPMS